MSNNFDVLIKGGMVVTGAGMARADLGIRGEKIAELGPDLDRGTRPANHRCDRQVRAAGHHRRAHPSGLPGRPGRDLGDGGPRRRDHHDPLRLCPARDEAAGDAGAVPVGRRGQVGAGFRPARRAVRRRTPTGGRAGRVQDGRHVVQGLHDLRQAQVDDRRLLAHRADGRRRPGAGDGGRPRGERPGDRLSRRQISAGRALARGDVHRDAARSAGGRGAEPGHVVGAGHGLPAVRAAQQRGGLPRTAAPRPGQRLAGLRRDVPAVPDVDPGDDRPRGAAGEDRPAAAHGAGQRGALAGVGRRHAGHGGQRSRAEAQEGDRRFLPGCLRVAVHRDDAGRDLRRRGQRRQDQPAPPRPGDVRDAGEAVRAVPAQGHAGRRLRRRPGDLGSDPRPHDFGRNPAFGVRLHPLRGPAGDRRAGADDAAGRRDRRGRQAGGVAGPGAIPGDGHEPSVHLSFEGWLTDKTQLPRVNADSHGSNAIICADPRKSAAALD